MGDIIQYLSAMAAIGDSVPEERTGRERRGIPLLDISGRRRVRQRRQMRRQTGGGLGDDAPVDRPGKKVPIGVQPSSSTTATPSPQYMGCSSRSRCRRRRRDDVPFRALPRSSLRNRCRRRSRPRHQRRQERRRTRSSEVSLVSPPDPHGRMPKRSEAARRQ